LQASFRSLGVWGKCFGAASSSSLAPLFDLRARSPLGAAFPNFDLSPRRDEVLFGRHSRTAPCLEVNLPRLTGSGKPRADAPGRWPRRQANTAPRVEKYHDCTRRDTPFDLGRLDGGIARVTDGLAIGTFFIVFVWRPTEVSVRRFLVGPSK